MEDERDKRVWRGHGQLIWSVMRGHVKPLRTELFARSHETAPARQLAFSPTRFRFPRSRLPARIASASLTNRFEQIERSISYLRVLGLCSPRATLSSFSIASYCSKLNALENCTYGMGQSAFCLLFALKYRRYIFEKRLLKTNV